jgi:lipopolysaccharide export system protein LptA
MYLAGAFPLPAPARANVRTVDVGREPTIAVKNLGTSSSVGTSRTATIADGIQSLALTDASGATVIRPFRAWVLRSRSLEPGVTPTTFSVLDVRLEGTRKPTMLAEYEARAGAPVLDVTASADEATFLLVERLWNEARLTGNVDVRATDQNGRPGRLRTDDLLCHLDSRQVETRSRVVVERPGFVLKGEGLRADVGLKRRVEVLRDVSLVLDLAEAELPWSSAPADDAPFLVRCNGPLVVEELDAEEGETRRLRVTAAGDVGGTRGDTSAMGCDALTMLLRMLEKPESEEGDDVQILEIGVTRVRPLILTSTAGDRVRVEGEKLEWRRRGDQAWEATVTGAPDVVLTPPGDVPEVEIRSEGPATILVEGREGLAEAVFDGGVAVRRGAETLRGDVVSIVRRPEMRSLAARGEVSIDGPTLRADADELQRIEREDGSRRTTLSGAPRIVFSGAGGLDLLSGRAPSASGRTDDTETDVSAAGPIRLIESPSGSTAKADGGVLVVRRAAGRETGRLSAKTAVLSLSGGEGREVETLDAHGNVAVAGTTADARHYSVGADSLGYRRDGERLVLNGGRPHLRLEGSRGVTMLRGERITWSRLSGEFDATGPVDASLPAGVDLLRPGASAEDGETERVKADPVRLTCDRLQGVLHAGEEGRRLSLRSALATGGVVLANASGRVAGDRLLLAAETDGFSARISGRPARIERRLAGGHVDVLEGPEILAGAGAEGDVRTMRAPKGARVLAHFLPKPGTSGSLTRIDMRCGGAVSIGEESLDAPGGVTAEHATWDAKKRVWSPPLKLSGRRMTGSFAADGPDGGRRVETLELRDDVRVEPPAGDRLECAWARILPDEETVEFGGTPDIVWRSARGRVRRAASARYCYRPDLEEGTRLRVVIPRRGGR